MFLRPPFANEEARINDWIKVRQCGIRYYLSLGDQRIVDKNFIIRPRAEFEVMENYAILSSNKLPLLWEFSRRLHIFIGILLSLHKFLYIFRSSEICGLITNARAWIRLTGIFGRSRKRTFTKICCAFLYG